MTHSRLTSPCSPPEVRMFGLRLHSVTLAEAEACAEGFIAEGHPHIIVTTDASGIIGALDDPELREIINSADLVTPDGAGVVLAARILGLPVRARCSGCDLVERLCRVATACGRSVYLFGAAPGVAKEAAVNLQKRVEGLQVGGSRDGYFQPEDEPGIVAAISAAKPAVLFVALGIPRQEKWIKSHMQELGVPVCIGIGGSFDVISGRKKRAPVWMQRVGLEWLYRTAKEPWRFPRLKALPRIVCLALGTRLRLCRSFGVQHSAF